MYLLGLKRATVKLPTGRVPSVKLPTGRDDPPDANAFVPPRGVEDERSTGPQDRRLRAPSPLAILGFKGQGRPVQIDVDEAVRRPRFHEADVRQRDDGRVHGRMRPR